MAAVASTLTTPLLAEEAGGVNAPGGGDRAKVTTCVEVGERIQGTKVNDTWLSVQGGGFVQIKDEDGVNMHEEESAVAIPEWQNSNECAFKVEEDNIQNELAGSFLETCHFGIGDRFIFLDENEINTILGKDDGPTGCVVAANRRRQAARGLF